MFTVTMQYLLTVDA